MASIPDLQTQKAALEESIRKAEEAGVDAILALFTKPDVSTLADDLQTIADTQFVQSNDPISSYAQIGYMINILKSGKSFFDNKNTMNHMLDAKATVTPTPIPEPAPDETT